MKRRVEPYFEFVRMTETGQFRFRHGGLTAAGRAAHFDLWKRSNPEIVQEARRRRKDIMLTFNMMEAKVVLAIFPNTPDKEYAYFVPDGDDPQVGDVILTSTSWDTFKGPEYAQPVKPKGKSTPFDTDDEELPSTIFNVNNAVSNAYTGLALEAKLARVIDVTAAGHPKANRFYMKLVSVRELRATHEMNQSMAAKAKEVREAYAQLDKMLAAESRNDLYRRLAERNPDAQKLLSVIEGKT